MPFGIFLNARMRDLLPFSRAGAGKENRSTAEKTAKKGQLEKDSQSGKARMGQARQNSQNKTAWQERVARAALQERAPSTGLLDKTARAG
jgi:hypothetical protein